MNPLSRLHGDSTSQQVRFQSAAPRKSPSLGSPSLDLREGISPWFRTTLQAIEQKPYTQRLLHALPPWVLGNVVAAPTMSSGLPVWTRPIISLGTWLQEKTSGQSACAAYYRGLQRVVLAEKPFHQVYKQDAGQLETIVLHELGHGLNYTQLTDPNSGQITRHRYSLACLPQYTDQPDFRAAYEEDGKEITRLQKTDAGPEEKWIRPLIVPSPSGRQATCIFKETLTALISQLTPGEIFADLIAHEGHDSWETGVSAGLFPRCHRWVRDHILTKLPTP